MFINSNKNLSCNKNIQELFKDKYIFVYLSKWKQFISLWNNKRIQGVCQNILHAMNYCHYFSLKEKILSLTIFTIWMTKHARSRVLNIRLCFNTTITRNRIYLVIVIVFIWHIIRAYQEIIKKMHMKHQHSK